MPFHPSSPLALPRLFATAVIAALALSACHGDSLPAQLPISVTPPDTSVPGTEPLTPKLRCAPSVATAAAAQQTQLASDCHAAATGAAS